MAAPSPRRAHEPVDAFQLLARYYPPDSAGYALLMDHSRRVMDRALSIARRLVQFQPDLEFIREAALLHDIGIFKTYAPTLGCHGREPYIRHGILGREILESHGLPRHARVCERHVGVGISISDIRFQRLPLPPRDMRPKTLEEEIICYADLFYSKNGRGGAAKSLDQIMQSMTRFGENKVATVRNWSRRFGEQA